jgi:serine protease Do
VFGRVSCLIILSAVALCNHATAQTDPAKEPAVVAVNKVWPAVVNINTERTVRRTVHDPFDQIFYEFFGGPMRPPRELNLPVQSLGSGFIVDPTGYIVTNEHVVERAADLKIQVTTADGATHDAEYIAGDPKSDLAFIRIKAQKPLPFIDLQKLSPNHLGQSVLVLGNPLGYGISVSRGILSANKRTISVGDFEFKNLLQTDAAINPGNSGGPIIDLAGNLVGVSSVKMAYTPQGVPTQGIGFGIPGDVIQDRVREFTKLANTQKERPPLVDSGAWRAFGLRLQDLTQALSEAFNHETGRGVLVADVEKNGPAAKAGFERGLVIYQVGRYEVSTARDVDLLTEQIDSGETVEFLVGATRRIGDRYVRQVQKVALVAR